MAGKKLSLTINETILNQIKIFAAKKGVSVSKLTSVYYESLLRADKERSVTFVNKFAGSIKKKIPINIKKEKEKSHRK